MAYFKDKTVFITGASRGIGKAIALKLAREGAGVVIAAKTSEPHLKLPGTIYTTAEEIEQAGGKALPLVVDVRSEEMVEKAVEKSIKEFGGIDILINNASALNTSGTLDLEMKRFDLMHQINFRGTFMVSQKCIPHLKKAANPHILNLSPPLNFQARWFAPHVAYSISKFNMSLLVLGMAQEFKQDGIGINALWPRTLIATAAIANLAEGDKLMKQARTPRIVADAAYFILRRNSRECTGNYFIDEDVLSKEGVRELDGYAVDPKSILIPDIFL
ncbi:MAG: NAD(P)-dependent oxidoreductase [Desulfobacterales bacterium]|jgi:citronellol/citronellal dehydrogenase